MPSKKYTSKDFVAGATLTANELDGIVNDAQAEYEKRTAAIVQPYVKTGFTSSISGTNVNIAAGEAYDGNGKRYADAGSVAFAGAPSGTYKIFIEAATGNFNKTTGALANADIYLADVSWDGTTLSNLTDKRNLKWIPWTGLDKSGSKLIDLDDVSDGPPANGDVPVWNSAQGKWLFSAGGGSGGYSEIQEDGVSLTHRSILNFGTGLVASDNAAQTRTDVNIQNDSSVQKIDVRKNSGANNVGSRRRLNFIEGNNITLTVADDATDNEIDITIAAATAAGNPGGLNQQIQFNDNGVFGGDAGNLWDKTKKRQTIDSTDLFPLIVSSSHADGAAILLRDKGAAANQQSRFLQSLDGNLFFGLGTPDAEPTTLTDHGVFTKDGYFGINTTTPHSFLHVAGSFATKVVVKSANYTLAANDQMIEGDATSYPITLTLPTAVGIAGRIYTVKKVDNTANAVTVVPAGGETIDGAGSVNLAAQWDTVTIISNGSHWRILGKYPQGGGGLSGSGAATRVAYWSGTSTLTGSDLIQITNSGKTLQLKRESSAQTERLIEIYDASSLLTYIAPDGSLRVKITSDFMSSSILRVDDFDQVGRADFLKNAICEFIRTSSDATSFEQRFKKGRGDITLPQAVLGNDDLMKISIIGYVGGGYQWVEAASILARARGTISDSPNGVGGDIILRTRSSGGNLVEHFLVDHKGNVVISSAALATTAADGFLYIPTTAGAPTGTPTSYSGRVPIVYDTVGNRLYIYSGAWRSVLLS